MTPIVLAAAINLRTAAAGRGMEMSHGLLEAGS